MALRASFVIDKAGVVQIQHVNNLNIGRNIDEVYRGLQALQFTEEHGEVCPADWQQGNKALKATREGIEGFFGSK